uniref:VQ motif-containing protein 8, chloroplastic-like n=1 Tax=Nicotiana tabacum TaxID=4097 RepID=A0A1S4A937_TOBAC|nr:PREDICTED: VQ motif-containing protein 8, chloroplastic-like [Nicotiana tabacum]
MNQEKFDGTRRIINGPRPCPLKIKESHAIRKPSNSSTVQVMARPLKKQNGPVIIYTESPKIIHTEARDFMALVQKLTGHSRSENENDESFSVEIDKNKSSSSSSPIYKLSNPYLADFPLFTQNSTNLFCALSLTLMDF